MTVHYTRSPRVQYGHSSLHPTHTCAVHNFMFIMRMKFLSLMRIWKMGSLECDNGELAEGPLSCIEKKCAEVKWDEIAQAMWESYIDMDGREE